MSQILASLGRLVANAEIFKSDIYIGLLVLVIVYLINSTVKKAKSNFPPGPRGWPIVGYLPYLSSDSHLDFIEVGKKYGDVFSVKLGSETIVVLHGVEAIKECLGKPEFLGRPPEGLFKIFNEGSPFFVGDVQLWKEHRRFVVSSMKDLGLGKSQIEGEIMDEIHYFLNVLQQHQGKSINLHEPLSPSMSNNICTLVFGKRYQYTDPDRIYLDKSLTEATETLGQTSFTVFFPWILSLPLVEKLLGLKKTLLALNNLKSFFRQEIKKHKDTFDSKHIRDFIDSFFIEMASRKKKDPNTTFSDETLMCDVLDLFAAGSETVRTSILWCMYVVADFKDSQKKIQQEILEVMGPDRDPEFQDIKRMPITHSFILEVMRWKTIVPLNIAHYTVADATVGGYDIPKNTIILTNLWHAHHDPKYWKDPDSFMPDRFIGKDGYSVSRPNHFMPFSMGKRSCPGEPMAMMEVFLYFTSILKKFEVVFPEGFKPTYEATLGGTYRLNPYKLRFISRN